MRKINFNVPIYNWNITIVTLYDKNDYEPLKQLLDERDLPEKEDTLQALSEGGMNGGKTHTRGNSREIVILIYPWADEATFFDIINHEKRHTIDRILEWHNIEDSEAAAYLDGYVSKQIFNNLQYLK